MNAKRILAIVLAFVMLLGTLLLTACNSTSNDPVTDDTTTAKKPDDTTKPVGGGDEKVPAREDAEPTTDENYSGRTWNVLDAEGSDFFIPNGSKAQTIEDVVAKRTLYIEEKYDIEIVPYPYSGHSDYTTLQASYLGGDQLYDLILPHPTINFTPLITSGMLQDLNDSATLGGHIDTTKLYWQQGMVESYTINGRLFMCAGDATLGVGSFVVLNKAKYDATYPEEDIYDVVFDGKWTMQKVIDLATENYDEEAGEFGYSMHQGHVSEFYFSCGETLLKRTEDGGYELKYDVDRCEKIAEKVYNLVIGPQTHLDTWYNGTFLTTEAWKGFASQNIFMLYMDVGAFGNMVSTLDFSTAYLPTPKYDEAQENYLHVAGGGFMGIPNDAKDLPFAALMLETLNWYSYHNYRPVYIDSYLSALLAKNENDYKIFNMYLNNGVYDMGYILDSSGLESGRAVGMFKTVIIENLSYNVSSYIEEWEEACNTKFQETLQEIY